MLNIKHWITFFLLLNKKPTTTVATTTKKCEHLIRKIKRMFRQDERGGKWWRGYQKSCLIYEKCAKSGKFFYFLILVTVAGVYFHYFLFHFCYPFPQPKTHTHTKFHLIKITKKTFVVVNFNFATLLSEVSVDYICNLVIQKQK